MPIPDATYSTLQLMIQDVRMLTSSLSDQQISDARIMYLLNSFVLYDMPSTLRLKALRVEFDFYTSPFQDVYQTNTTNPNDPFYNFNNKYINTFEPFFCAGYKGAFTQSRETFFNLYPNIATISLLAMGNNAQITYSGFIPTVVPNVFPSSPIVQPNVCLVRNQVLFNSIDQNGNALTMVDTPINALFGNLSFPNNPPTSLVVVDPNNFINYVTGQFTVSFTNSVGAPTAPGTGQNINSQSVVVAPAQPQTLLWFDNMITLRPVPDQSYKISIEANIRPSELLNSTDMPLLSQWYQYIVYGTATKVAQYRRDDTTVAILAPEFKKQELLVMRTTLVQNTKQRVPTIFNQTHGTTYGPGFGFFGNTNF